MNALLVIAAIGMVGVLFLLVSFFNEETIWDWLTGGGYQPQTDWPPYPPPKPKVLRNFGAHHNPISLDGECTSDFVQVDDRTWQCTECQLIRYEKSNESSPTVQPTGQ